MRNAVLVAAQRLLERWEISCFYGPSLDVSGIVNRRRSVVESLSAPDDDRREGMASKDENTEHRSKGQLETSGSPFL